MAQVLLSNTQPVLVTGGGRRTILIQNRGTSDVYLTYTEDDYPQDNGFVIEPGAVYEIPSGGAGTIWLSSATDRNEVRILGGTAHVEREVEN